MAGRKGELLKILIGAPHLILHAHTLGNVVVRFQYANQIAFFVALGYPARKSNDSGTSATCVDEFARPAAVSQKYLPNSRQRLRKLGPQKFVRNLAQDLLASEAVHLLRGSIPIKDAILSVTHKNGIAAQVEQVGLFNQTLLGFLALSNVAGDLRSADNTTLVILHRGDSEGEVDKRTILAPPHRFEVVHALALPEFGENFRFFFLAVIGDQQRGHGLADGFFGRIAEEALRA